MAHWLHSYNIHNLDTINKDFEFSAPDEEDPLFCQPRYHGSVAIAWHKNLNHIVKRIPVQRICGIQQNQNPYVSSQYTYTLSIWLH